MHRARCERNGHGRPMRPAAFDCARADAAWIEDMFRRARKWVTAVGCGLAVAGCSMFGAAPHKERLFVSNYKDDTLSVVDCATDREIKVLPVGGSPVGLAARRTPPLLAVANTTGGRVTLIDPGSLEVIRTVEVDDIPEHLVFSTDGKQLYVTLPKAKQLAIIDPDAGVVREKVVLERKPKRLAVSPDGRRLYILFHSTQGGVGVMDLTTHNVQTVIPTGAFPMDFGISRDGRRLVAASFDEDKVTVIDTESLQPIVTWDVPTGLALVVHPTQPLAYSMEGFDDTVHVLNYETGQVIASFPTGRFPTYSAITADGRYLYVVNEESDHVLKLDTETNERLDRIVVGAEPGNALVVDSW